ncbi:hypothetical protein RHO12_04185 [Orbus sturtevantii]|uniref:hypothetical protein n=1 Tax=Orbus sturtevantii TaxID=3074109 RepID=UPI00370DD067
MSEYYALFSQYFNVLSVIWGGIKFGLFSFILALIVLILFRKVVLVSRRYCVQKYIARSYYFFIPVICLVFGSGYGFIITARDQVISKLPIYQTAAQSFIDQNIDININVKAIVYASKNLDDVIDDVIVDIKQSMVTKFKLADQNQQKIQQIMLRAVESPVGIKFIKSKLKEQLSTTTGIKRQLVNKVFEIKLSTLLTGEMVIEIIYFYVLLAVNSLLLPLIIVWAILLMIPLVEISVAYFYDKKHRVVT